MVRSSPGRTTSHVCGRLVAEPPLTRFRRVAHDLGDHGREVVVQAEVVPVDGGAVVEHQRATVDDEPDRFGERPVAAPAPRASVARSPEVLLGAGRAADDEVAQPGQRRAPHALADPAVARVGQPGGEGLCEQATNLVGVELPVRQHRAVELGHRSVGIVVRGRTRTAAPSRTARSRRARPRPRTPARGGRPAGDRPSAGRRAAPTASRGRSPCWATPRAGRSPEP